VEVLQYKIERLVVFELAADLEEEARELVLFIIHGEGKEGRRKEGRRESREKERRKKNRREK
jgi:hypothetical protein